MSFVRLAVFTTVVFFVDRFAELAEEGCGVFCGMEDKVYTLDESGNGSLQVVDFVGVEPGLAISMTGLANNQRLSSIFQAGSVPVKGV